MIEKCFLCEVIGVGGTWVGQGSLIICPKYVLPLLVVHGPSLSDKLDELKLCQEYLYVFHVDDWIWCIVILPEFMIGPEVFTCFAA